MSISYTDLPFRELLHHQGAYDRINETGQKLIADWDMVRFERTVLGSEMPFYSTEHESKLKESLQDLDIQMPFVLYRDPGTHYGYELFLVPQQDLGYQCPMFWAYLARAFTYDTLPMDEAYFEEKYKSICSEFGVNIKYYSRNYVNRFDNYICGETSLDDQALRWGWNTVRDRNRFLHSNPDPVPELYLNKAIERLKWYVEKEKQSNYLLNPNIDSKLLMYYLDNGRVTARRKEIVTTLWGLYTGTPLKYREVAELLGVTHNRIRQAERETLLRMTSGRYNNLWSHTADRLF